MVADGEMADLGDDDSPDDYGVAPSPPPPPFSLLLSRDLEEIEQGVAEPPPPDESPEDLQFSLAEMLWLTAGVAVYLGLTSLLSNSFEAFVGGMGLVVLVVFVSVDLMQVRRRIIRVACWLALAVYLAGCIIVAVWR